jgi:adenosine/AMP kinase
MRGRAILGVVDGFRSKGVEAETDIEDRKQFLRKIGYKI